MAFQLATKRDLSILGTLLDLDLRFGFLPLLPPSCSLVKRCCLEELERCCLVLCHEPPNVFWLISLPPSRGFLEFLPFLCCPSRACPAPIA